MKKKCLTTFYRENKIFKLKDFENICFYYFLPSFNYIKKIEIGEKINLFKGVSLCFIFNIFYFRL